MFVMQGVRELLKGASKDSYTLRFATEGEAQHWLTAFRLIIKVEFRFDCDFACAVTDYVACFKRQLFAFFTPQFQHTLSVGQRIISAQSR
jgi:hypothetical protein